MKNLIIQHHAQDAQNERHHVQINDRLIVQRGPNFRAGVIRPQHVSNRVFHEEDAVEEQILEERLPVLQSDMRENIHGAEYRVEREIVELVVVAEGVILGREGQPDRHHEPVQQSGQDGLVGVNRGYHAYAQNPRYWKTSLLREVSTGLEERP